MTPEKTKEEKKMVGPPSYLAPGRGSGSVKRECNDCRSKEITHRCGKYYLCDECAEMHLDMGHNTKKIEES